MLHSFDKGAFEVPLSLRPMCVSFPYTNQCDKLRLIYASGLEPSAVLCLAIDRKRVYTASGSVIRAWKKGRMVSRFSATATTSTVIPKSHQ